MKNPEISQGVGSKSSDRPESQRQDTIIQAMAIFESFYFGLKHF